MATNAFADDPRSWQRRAPIPEARSGVSAVVLDNQVYVIGGRNEAGQILNTVSRYDPANDTWTTVQPMTQARFNAAAVVHNNKIYVMGGRGNSSAVLDKAEVFDPVAQTWTDISNLRESREGLAAFVQDNTLYVAGGSNGNAQILNTVEYFDEAGNTWRDFSAWNLDVARASFSALTFADSVYTFGGFSTFGPLNQVQRYHPASGVTSLAPFMPARGGLTAAPLDDAIYVMGGRMSDNDVVDIVNRFIPAENRWELAAPLLEARENAAAVFADNQLFVFGGEDAAGNILASVEAFDVIAAPIANNDAISTLEDTAVVVDVLRNDTDPAGSPLNISGFTQPLQGTVTQVDNQSFRYEPADDFNGLDLFSYTIQNAAGAAALATVQITVTPVNDAPQVRTDPVTGILTETAYVYEISASDAEGDAITITVNPLPDWLTFLDRGDGSAALSGTPAPADAGTVPIVLTFSDGQDNSTQNFDLLVVTALPAIPILTFPANETTVDTTPVAFTWIGSDNAQYRFQLASNEAFNDILVDSTLTSPEVTLFPPDGSKFWRVRAFNAAGTSDWSATFSFGFVSTVGVDDELPAIPFALAPAYPNPFITQVTIPFQLELPADLVSVAIYTLAGQEIRQLLQHPLPAGSHQISWDGLDNQARSVASGRYLVVLKVQGTLQSQVLLLVR
ncbi:MAG: kelch repeat-containing protein [Bacteroidota bacterium]